MTPPDAHDLLRQDLAAHLEALANATAALPPAWQGPFTYRLTMVRTLLHALDVLDYPRGGRASPVTPPPAPAPAPTPLPAPPTLSPPAPSPAASAADRVEQGGAGQGRQPPSPAATPATEPVATPTTAPPIAKEPPPGITEGDLQNLLLNVDD